MTQPDHSPRRLPSAPSRLLLVSLLAMLLSACTMRALIGVEVDPDGSGTFQVSMAFDEELRALMEEEASEPIDWSDPGAFDEEGSPTDLVDEFPEGASVSAYSEGDFEGFTVSVEFASLEELDQLLSETSSDGEEAFPFRIAEPEEGRFELSTHGEIFGEDAAQEEGFEMFSESMLQDLFDMRLQVSLPGEVISTNADETTEDGVMVWRLNPMAEDEVRPEAVSEVSSSSPIAVLLLVGLLVAGAAVAGVVFLRRGSAESAEPVTEPAAEPEDAVNTTG